MRQVIIAIELAESRSASGAKAEGQRRSLDILSVCSEASLLLTIFHLRVYCEYWKIQLKYALVASQLLCALPAVNTETASPNDHGVARAHSRKVWSRISDPMPWQQVP